MGTKIVNSSGAEHGRLHTHTEATRDVGLNQTLRLISPEAVKRATEANVLEAGRFCTGWVCFDGSGTVSIRDDCNFSGITDSGTGMDMLAIDDDMDNANYAAVATGDRPSSYGDTIASEITRSSISTRFGFYEAASFHR